MKRAHQYFFIVALSILPFLIVLANPNLLHTSDGGVHLPRMAAYVKALLDSHIPVRWAGDLNYGYGLPLFNFMYPAPYIFASAFILSGLSLVTSFKLVLALSYVLSGVFMYMFARELFGDGKKALLVTLFYQFAPFRFVELLIRGAMGGVFAYSFLPLVLYGAVRMNKKQSYGNFFVTTIAVFALIISHNALSMVFFGVSILFTLCFVNKKSMPRIFLALILGLAIASFYWIPALFEHKYTYGDLFMKDLFRQHFPPFLNFFIPNLFYDKRLLTAEISVQLGFFHVIAALLGIYLLITHKLKDALSKKITIFGLTLTGISLIIMQPISLPLWEHIALIRQFQFPWRFLALTSFSTSLLAMTYVFALPPKKWIYAALLVLTVGTTAYYWYPREGFDVVRETDFWNYPLNTTYFGETDLVWSAGPAKGFPPARIQVISGNATVSDLIKKTQTHIFTVEATTDAKLVDNTQYFPGWRVYDNGNRVPIEFQDQNWRGLITFPVARGHHTIKVIFGESNVRILADVASSLSLGVLMTLWALRKKLRI